jgi:hypothetical protein
MKSSFILCICLLNISIVNAQKITGRWYSADSSRLYEIKELPGNSFTAVIQSSSRKNDSIGYTILQNLTYNSHKKRYEGYIYSVTDNKPVFVKIFFDKKNDNRIILKISRMLVMDVAINWVRAES